MKYNFKEAFKNLNELGIKTMGLRAMVTYDQNLEELFIGYDETSKYVDVTLSIENTTFDDNDEESTKEICLVNATLFTTYDEMTGDFFNFMDVIDSIDQDTYECLSVFIDNRSKMLKDSLEFSRILYVNSIELEKEYREKGFESIILEYIKYKFSDILTAIVIEPFTIAQLDESLDFTEVESDLIGELYKKHGFKNYKSDTWLYYENLF